MTWKPEFFSCRVYGVLVRAGRVLLTRSRFKGREFVNFPGGGVELGEAPIEAPRREYREETGLEARPRRVLYASEGLHVSTQVPMQIISVYWEVRAEGDPRMDGNDDDVVRLFWAEVDRIPTGEMFPADLEFSARLSELIRSS